MSEIPGFLSDEECDHLISKAEDEGMRSSIARGGLTKLDKWEFHSTSKLKSSFLKSANSRSVNVLRFELGAEVLDWSDIKIYRLLFSFRL